MLLRKPQIDVDPSLAAFVRTNTVSTLASLPLERLVEAAYMHGDNKDKFMLGCVADAATVRLIEVDRAFMDLNIARANGEETHFEERLGLLIMSTSYEYVQAFAQGRSEYLPPVF
jgi:hypothetical protein